MNIGVMVERISHFCWFKSLLDCKGEIGSLQINDFTLVKVISR